MNSVNFVNKILVLGTFVTICTTLAIMPSATMAANGSSRLSHNLGYGTTGSSQVSTLQQFLNSQGYLSAAPTGNFLSQTYNAVKKFQQAHNIPATGYVGPLTLAAVNSAISSSASGSITVTSPVSGTISVGDTQTVDWTSSAYPDNTVSVSLIRQTGTNPDNYSLVRTISASKPNDGTATWVPAVSDAGAELSIQVGCTLTSQACTAGDDLSSSLAVVSTGADYQIANAYQAIEAADNR